jgi:hypothetical protein
MTSLHGEKGHKIHMTFSGSNKDVFVRLSQGYSGINLSPYFPALPDEFCSLGSHNRGIDLYGDRKTREGPS